VPTVVDARAREVADMDVFERNALREKTARFTFDLVIVVVAALLGFTVLVLLGII
jgi:hypothetical protein